MLGRFSFSLVEKRIVYVEGFFPEEIVYQRHQDLLIEIIVDLTSENGLTNERSKGVPRNLVWIDGFSSFSDAVKPFITAVKNAQLVTLIELVNLGPSDWNISQSLLHNSIKPSDNKMKF